MENLLKKVETTAHVFFGISEGNLFAQIATQDNEIVYEAEVPMSDPTPANLMRGLSELFPDKFKESGVKVSRVAIFEWDGQKIVKSGGKEILDCQTILNIFPKFSVYLFTYLWENGKY
jgi:hypothetical protein